MKTRASHKKALENGNAPSELVDEGTPSTVPATTPTNPKKRGQKPKQAAVEAGNVPPQEAASVASLTDTTVDQPASNTANGLKVKSKISRGRGKKQKNVHAQDESCRQSTTIGMLPDDVLLEIFDLYRRDPDNARRNVWKWHLLVHVCQRWREIAFASPHRLKLQILCTSKTPFRKNLGIWPAIPIVVDYYYPGRSNRPRGEGSVIAALKHTNRVCSVTLEVRTGSRLGKIATVMQKPFPVLTRLHIHSQDGAFGDAPVLPAEFLGGSAPCLQEISLSGIPYPTLPSLLLSTSDLVTLELRDVPPTGYISPEAMVVCLAALPRLETLGIEIYPAHLHPHRIPEERTVLPALTSFKFRGTGEYLDDLVSRIDSPQLDQISISYLSRVVEVTQLSEFVGRSVGRKFTTGIFEHPQIGFFSSGVSFIMDGHGDLSCLGSSSVISLVISIDPQVSHMAVLRQFSATFSTVVHLVLNAWLKEDRQLEGTNNVEWQRLFHQFSAVQTLLVSPQLAGHVALALEDITEEMVAQVLPSLDLIYFESQPVPSMEKFVAARKVSGRPVTVVNGGLGRSGV